MYVFQVNLSELFPLWGLFGTTTLSLTKITNFLRLFGETSDYCSGIVSHDNLLEILMLELYIEV